MRYLLFLSACLLFLQPSKASDNPQLDYLGIEHGLSNNAVNCIYQDKYGFMWFGTYDGLNFFDGYTFKTYRNRLNDPNSLVNNWVVAIHEDYRHNILVGTKQGANIFNIVTGKFSLVQYRPFKEEKVEQLSYATNGFDSDKSGNVFIATAGRGLIILEKGSKAGHQIPFHVDGHNGNYHVQSVKVDNNNRVWLFIQGYGLALYDQKNKSIKIINSVIQVAKCIQPDGAGNVWIGNEYGVHEYHIKSRKIISHHEEEGFLSANNIHGLLLDRSGQLWISTDGGGVTILDLKSRKLRYLLPGKDKGMLTSGAVNAVFEDKEDRKWIGTLRGGINVLDSRKNRFKTIAHNPLSKNSVLSNFILSFCEDKKSNVWIGTDGEGISYWDRKNNLFTNYRHRLADPKSLSNNNVAGIVSDSANEIWVATYGGGINKFNASSGSFIPYSCYNPVTKNTDQNAWGIYEDRKKTLWVGTCTGGGVYQLNKNSNRFELFDASLGDILSFFEDNDGNLWGGNFTELVKIDRFTKKHKRYLFGRVVRAIYEDKKGRFWVGTEGAGLLLFDRKTGKYETYTEDEGLPNNAILNILEDNAGNLWLSTFNGLSRFNPTTKRFKNFYESDGLQSNQFNYNAALKLRSGELIFGGIKGFNIFFPQEIKSLSNSPKLIITGLRTNNIPYGQEGSAHELKNIYEVDEITLPYDKAVLSVDFAALEYSSPNKIFYSYYLEGWDNNWNHAGKTRTVNYSKLREGNYRLRIKSTNAEGVWLNNERVLVVKVLPPWWRSWWAYCLYGISALSALYLYTLYHKRQNYLRYQIELANLKVEQEKELNEKKLSFFTNISHEFRTPLTLIISPIQEFLNSRNAQVDSKELTVVYRNARRLLSLVDQLLHFRKSDADELKVTKFNLVVFCKEVYLCFIQQAKSKNLDFEFICDAKEIEIYADKEKIEIALFNLISNAFKFTPLGGKISFSLSDSDSEVQLIIADTGPGISDEVGEKLFDKFYQVSDKESNNKTGFGIGLYLVKKFVENHSGKVSYLSEKGRGTIFKVELLKGKDHFDSKLVSESLGEMPVFLDELVGNVLPEMPEALSDGKADIELVSEKATMLIIDDNEDIRNYIKRIFQSSYTIIEAGSGEQGYLLTQKHIPDIVITDVVMGEMSGVELCLKIKEDPALSHIPVILLTSSSSAEIKLKGVEGGADDYITKPFDKDILIARVINLLKSRTNLQRFFYNHITFKSDDSKVSPEFKDFLQKCITITEKHLDNPDFNIKTLADEIGISHSALYKKVKSISGKSINEFIRFIRLRKAAELFINSDCNVNEGAFQSGFNDIKYFREQFSKLFGMKPSEYIKSYRKPFSQSYKLNPKITKS
ncbi:two-component regulator propeller domain-containing protein [Paradesertivirga mongoliensis]|uniref:histidine kinase n=1 Tax=Paradesertivirga mongoliensis TaxID=2100740 RepID=A0ABW4ZG33_9SPHI|nr:two-component regulator propeller domain-containing protein [Pedobacter mongoliensis]